MLFFGKRYIGRTFKGYRISQIIGQGRYGACFLATSPDGTSVVLKRYHNRMRKKNREKNHYEPVILSALNHPDIPSLLGVINAGKDYFYVLEHMPGKSIETMLFSEHHPFSSEEIYRIGLQLINIVSYLHTQNIVHRDIRTANVLYEKGTISLVDFGLARFADSNRYSFYTDFSYLGDFLLYLVYSSYTGKSSTKTPWYEELPLSVEKKQFLKRLMGLEVPYADIQEIKKEFITIFHCQQENESY